MKNNYNFFENKECKYYPCHNINEINCLFCFCPLYNYLNCEGNYILLPGDIKDCQFCNIPHKPENYDLIIKKTWDFRNKKN